MYLDLVYRNVLGKEASVHGSLLLPGGINRLLDHTIEEKYSNWTYFRGLMSKNSVNQLD